ncbi:MAG: hypothetical protein ACKODX_01080 [Gemmata sp.]
MTDTTTAPSAGGKPKAKTRTPARASGSKGGATRARATGPVRRAEWQPTALATAEASAVHWAAVLRLQVTGLVAEVRRVQALLERDGVGFEATLGALAIDRAVLDRVLVALKAAERHAFDVVRPDVGDNFPDLGAALRAAAATAGMRG